MARQTLPSGSVLLHVGPYKTGSTAIQTRLARARPELRAHDVAYPAPQRDSKRQANHRADRPGWAVIRWAPTGFAVPPTSVWDDFAAKVRSQTAARVCVSTEDFGSTGRVGLAKKIVEDLGGDNVHVVYVCRALHRVLPSHWQERVKSTMDHRSYEDWLRSVLIPAERDSAGTGFWKSHDLERVVTAWLGAIGPERFTIVATDDSDRSLLPATFEGMLGLPDGFLADEGKRNASLSWNDTELVRRLNALAADRNWSDADYIKLLRGGVLRGIQQTERAEMEESIPTIPEWAREPVAQIGRDRVEMIERRGLRVVGDLRQLLLPDDVHATANAEPPEALPIETAASAVACVFDRAFQLEKEARRGATTKAKGRKPAARLDLELTPGKDLVHEMRRRAQRRAKRRLRPIIQRVRGGR